MVRSVFSRLSLILAAFLLATPAQASRVSPMSVDLAPYGRESVARIQFTNTSSREFPIEARAYKGVISEYGELELIPADDDFIIFPPQLTVAPRGEQVFRIQYIGEPELERAEVYYLSISQLPIQMEPGAPKVQVLINFNVFVNVEPEGLEATPRVDTVTPLTQEEIDGIEVRVVNDGAGMLMAGKREWRLQGMNKDGTPFSRRIDAAELGGMIGVGIVAPDRARRFFIPIDDQVDRTTLTVEID